MVQGSEARSWPEAVRSAALQQAGSSNRGSGWTPSGPASPWACRAARSRQARSEEAREPRCGAGKRLTTAPAAARRVDAEPAHGLCELGVVERAGEVLVHRAEDGPEHAPRAQVLAQVLHDPLYRRALGRPLLRAARRLRRGLALCARRLALPGRAPVVVSVVVVAHLPPRHLDEVRGAGSARTASSREP